MSESTQTQTLEETLNKTDFGHTLYEHRKSLIALLVVILLGASFVSFWRQSKKNLALENAQRVFEFQTGIWTQVKEQKKDVSELVKAFNDLSHDVQAAPTMLPLILEMSQFLYQKDNFTEAESLLSKVSGSYKNDYLSFFAHYQHAVVLEKLDKIEQAINVLSPLAKGKNSFMLSMVSVQLGRLYLKNGNIDQAKTQFDYVISTFPNDDQAKIAKLYLAKIK